MAVCRAISTATGCKYVVFFAAQLILLWSTQKQVSVKLFMLHNKAILKLVNLLCVFNISRFKGAAAVGPLTMNLCNNENLYIQRLVFLDCVKITFSNKLITGLKPDLVQA